MLEFQELKRIVEFNEPQLGLSSLEQVVIKIIKNEFDFESLEIDEVITGLEFYRNPETENGWKRLLKNKIYELLKTDSDVAKAFAIELINDDSSFNYFNGLYNLESGELKIKLSKESQIFGIMNVQFVQSGLDDLREELNSMELPLNTFVPVGIKKVNSSTYEISLSESKEQEKENELREQRIKSLKSKASSTFWASVLLIGLGFSTETSAGALSDADIPVGDSKVSKAVNAAKDAALIQSGINKKLDAFEKKMLKSAEQTVKDVAGDAAPSLAALGYATKIAVDQEVEFKGKDFFFKDSTYTVTLSPNKVELNVKITLD